LSFSKEHTLNPPIPERLKISKPILSPDATYLELGGPGKFQSFYQGFIELLKRNSSGLTSLIPVPIIIPAARYMIGIIKIGIHFQICGRSPTENDWILSGERPD